MNKLLKALAATLAALLMQPAQASPGKWVTTWYASPQPTWGADFILPTNVPSTLENQTVRDVVRISAGGRRVRLVFSNRYGTAPLTIGEVRVALSPGGPATIAGTGRAVTFNGERAVTLPPGAPAVSDPLDMPLAPLTQLAVSSYYPQRSEVTTFHWGAQQTGYIAQGNRTDAARIDQGTQLKGRLHLSAVLVEAAPEARTVVAFGDSITEGNGSTPDQHRRWPDYLAQRLAPHGIGVANAGISGARVLGDRMGVNAQARFDQDVLSQPGVSAVIVLMGINDLGWPGSPFARKDTPMTAQALIGGYRQLIASARARGVRIVGATLPPFEGALHGTPFEGHYSAEKEVLRQRVNAWIRTAGEFDGVVDMDAVLRDPARPKRMLPAFDSGDHLHPGDAGYQAMAEAVEVQTLLGKRD